MNEKETRPAEIEPDETQKELVEEDTVQEEQQAQQEPIEQTQEDSLENAEEPEVDVESEPEVEIKPEIEPLITVNPVTQAEELVDPEIIEEQKEEIIVQDKYEKGLEKTRKTFGERLNELFANFRSVDEDFFEELEETLIGADVGFDTAIKITESLRQEVKLRNVKKPATVQNTIIEKMVDLYEAEGIEENNALNIQKDGLTVMLFVGVNGVGKTTSIGKLAHEFKRDGKKVLMA